MKYNFTDIIERNGKDAIAAEKIPYAADVQVKEEFSRIPMWVADMNFARRRLRSVWSIPYTAILNRGRSIMTQSSAGSRSGTVCRS